MTIRIQLDTMTLSMYTILRTEEFDTWLATLADERGKARIAARIISAEFGNFGDCKSVGAGVFEMRVDVGPGYRVVIRGAENSCICG